MKINMSGMQPPIARHDLFCAKNSLVSLAHTPVVASNSSMISIASKEAHRKQHKPAYCIQGGREHSYLQNWLKQSLWISSKTRCYYAFTASRLNSFN